MYVFTYGHGLTTSLSAASAPSDRSFATVHTSPFSLATCNADPVPVTLPWHFSSCREARTRTRQCPAPPYAASFSLAPPPLPSALLPFPLSRSAVPRPPPSPLPARSSHTTHTPNHAACATCRSRAPASLVTSISSPAAASCLLRHASFRAVLPCCA